MISSQEKSFISSSEKAFYAPIYKAQSRKQTCCPPMEEMMMVMMMKLRNHETSSNTTHRPNINPIIIPSSTACPTWKLYENPFYTSHNYQKQEGQQNYQLIKNQEKESTDQGQIHRIHLPISARKIATSFWDLTFIKSLMDSELETARAQIKELKAEIESERKARKKLESANKRLARELSEERKGREALERVCQELVKETSVDKIEINKMRVEIQKERKMMRVAEVIREERVQMKLAEAKILMEEKFMELEKKIGTQLSSSSLSQLKHKEETLGEKVQNSHHQSFSFGEKLRFILGEKTPNGNTNSMMVVQKRISMDQTENPHIKRGIKGFVEFPKVVKAISCRSSRHLNRKLEFQKAQLKILLKHKGPVRFNGLVAK